MAKRQSAKPENAKGRNADRNNGKAAKKNPQNSARVANSNTCGYSLATLERRAAKRNQSLDEHIDYVQQHRATKSVRHNEAKRKAMQS